MSRPIWASVYSLKPANTSAIRLNSALLVVGQRVPRLDEVRLVGLVLGHRVERGELGALGHDAALDHALEHPGAVRVVAVVELALVLVDVLLRCVVGRVVRSRAEPDEPGLRGVRGVLVADHADRLVREVLRQVVPLLRGVRRLDEAVVLHQVGVPLVGLAAEEAVEPVETHRERPGGLAAAGGDVLLGHVVVLAHPERRVAVVLQDLTDRRALSREAARVAGVAVRALHDDPDAVGVVVPPGQERRARRRADRRRVPLRVGQPVLRQPVHRGHVDPAPVRRPRRHPGVVVEDDEDVRRTLGRSLQLIRCPVRRRVPHVQLDVALEVLAHGALSSSVNSSVLPDHPGPHRWGPPPDRVNTPDGSTHEATGSTHDNSHRADARWLVVCGASGSRHRDHLVPR